MRRSLKLLLEREPDIEVVAESGRLATAIAQVSLLHPEVLVLDLHTADGMSLEIVRQLRAQARPTRTVVITMDDDEAFATYAHRAGALGFVLKDTADAELPEAVRRAARGQTYTSPRVAPTPVRPRARIRGSASGAGRRLGHDAAGGSDVPSRERDAHLGAPVSRLDLKRSG